MEGADLLGPAEHLGGGPLHDDAAPAHHDHPVGLGGFFHIVGDGHHRDAHVPVQPVDGLHHLLPAPGVQHGGGLVQDDAVGAHGHHPGDGHPLLLPARQVVRGALAQLVDAGHLHGVVDAAAHLAGGHAQVLQGKGHVLFHHGGHDLVVGVLKDHAHLLADVVELGVVGGVHPLHRDGAGLGQQDGVEVLGQGGLAAPVGPQHRHKLAPPHPHAHPVQCVAGGVRVVPEAQVLCLQNRFLHVLSLFRWRARPKAGLRPIPNACCFTPRFPRWRWSRRAPPRRWRSPAGRSRRSWSGRPSGASGWCGGCTPSPPGTAPPCSC